MDAPALEVEGLVKSYDGRAVVDHLSLTVRTGSVHALLGPNGAGKTTTVEICEGFRKPDAGRVKVLGQDPRERTLRPRVGVMPQTGGAYPGLRAGEMLALDWSNVDLTVRVIRVERAWDHGSHAFIAPKSKAARRVVPIAERLLAVLLDHREQFGDDGLVLPTLRGGSVKPMGHSALVKRLKTAWAGADLQSLKLHEARHTFASMLIAAGANPKAITTYMGHSSIQVTFDRYGHLMPGSEAQIAGLLDAYLEAGTA